MNEQNKWSKAQLFKTMFLSWLSTKIALVAMSRAGVQLDHQQVELLAAFIGGAYDTLYYAGTRVFFSLKGKVKRWFDAKFPEEIEHD